MLAGDHKDREEAIRYAKRVSISSKKRKKECLDWT